MSETYDLKRSIPNKMLNSDGSVTDLMGNAVVSTSPVWDSKKALPNKFLNPDGTYSTLQDIIGGGASLDLFIVVEELPDTGEENKVYLVPKENGEGFIEWIYVNEQWDTIGELEATVPSCNLGLISDYDSNNPLDLNTLLPGVYYLNTVYSTGTLFLKATYNNTTYTASWQFNEGYTNHVITITVNTTIPETVAESINFGNISYLAVQEGAISTRVYTKMTDIQLGTDAISASGGTVYNIQPVTLNRAQTITGVKTFNALPQSSVVPSANDDLVNKKYVDDSIVQQVFYFNSSSDAVNIENWEKVRQAQLVSDVLVYSSRGMVCVSKNTLTSGVNNLTFATQYERIRKNGYTELYGKEQLCKVTITNDVVTNVKYNAATSTDVNVIETDYNYSSPSTPQYPGSPATKQYVDNMILSTLGGEY